MSADNWATCPRCKIKHAEESVRRIASAEEQYGKVEPDEFIKLRQAALDFAVKIPDDTLREDWSIGVYSDSEFSVSYKCSCETCGFEHKFEHKEKLKI